MFLVVVCVYCAIQIWCNRISLESPIPTPIFNVQSQWLRNEEGMRRLRDQLREVAIQTRVLYRNDKGGRKWAVYMVGGGRKEGEGDYAPRRFIALISYSLCSLIATGILCICVCMCSFKECTTNFCFSCLWQKTKV